jgi:hypothetical protein
MTLGLLYTPQAYRKTGSLVGSFEHFYFLELSNAVKLMAVWALMNVFSQYASEILSVLMSNLKHNLWGKRASAKTISKAPGNL